MRPPQIVLAVLLSLFLLGCRTGKVDGPKPSPMSTTQPELKSIAGARPCEITIPSCVRNGKLCGEISQCIVTLARVAPEGTPLQLNLDGPKSYRWRYAADGRLLESPEYTFRHTDAMSGVRSRKDGKSDVAVTFDVQGRLAQIGTDLRQEYMPDGRIAGHSERVEGGEWQRTVTYEWGPEGTFRVSWTYPDADEYCEPSPSEVNLDTEGRVEHEVFEGCRINYSPFAVRYHYDEQGRFDEVIVECNPGEPEQVSYHLMLKYECE